MRTLILFAGIFFLNTAIAQYSLPVLTAQKCLGGSKNDFATDVLSLPDSGYIVIGDSYSNDGDVTSHYGTTATSDGWIVRLSKQREIVWQKNVGGTGNDRLKKIIKTNDGNFVATGVTLSKDNDAIENHGVEDAWVVKFSGDGDILWSKCYGGSKMDSVGSIVQTPDGGYIVVATTESNDGNLLGTGTRNYTDIWYFKIDENGIYKWGHTLGDAGYDQGEDIGILPDGNPVFSVIPSTESPEVTDDFPENHYTILRPWLVKIDTAGNIIWKKPVGKEINFNWRQMQYHAAIQFSSYGIATIVNGNNEGGLATLGNYEFVTMLSNYDGVSQNKDKYANFAHNMPDVVRAITISKNSFIALPDSMCMVAGFWEPVAMYSPIPAGTKGRAFIKKRSFKNTNVDTATAYFGGNNSDGFTALKQLSTNTFVAAGFTLSNDGDVSGNHGGSDFWIVNLSDTAAIGKNFIQGLAFIDNNSNNIFDNTDEPYAGLAVKSVRLNDSEEFKSFSKAGIFFNEVDTGTYSTTGELSLPYYTITSPQPHTSVFTTYGQRDTINLIVKPIPGKRDCEITLSSLSPARPGSSVVYLINCTNLGTDTVNNINVTMIKDSSLSLNLSSVPPPASINGDTISWIIPKLIPRSHDEIKVSLYVNKVPPEINLGDSIFSTVFIDTTGDLQPSNNYSFVKQIITGSYDPNDKRENNGNALRIDRYVKNKFLTYTIRFQNTGTDTAFNISIKDTLDEKFDFNTIRMISSSHDYDLNIKDGKYCNWQFDNIQLPDSFRNEAMSHGYIIYKIKLKEGLDVGDVVKNTASIYFDYNKPIQTNEVETHIVSPHVAKPEVSGLLSKYCRIDTPQSVEVANMPGEEDGVEVIVKLNDVVLEVAQDGNFQFTPSQFRDSLNELVVIFHNLYNTQTSTFEFTIVDVISPEVDLLSNNTLITRRSEPVVLTAKNVSGHTSTSYVFAKDRSFVNVLQAESEKNTFLLLTDKLSNGDNWVYVQMKVSDDCYAGRTAIDSIKLTFTNNQSNIIDSDNPGISIGVFPNPFHNEIKINGLLASKKYLIQVFNSQGRKVFSYRISNRDFVDITNLHFSPGVYLIRLFDENKNKELGIIKMLAQ